MQIIKQKETKEEKKKREKKVKYCIDSRMENEVIYQSSTRYNSDGEIHLHTSGVLRRDAWNRKYPTVHMTTNTSQFVHDSGGILLHYSYKISQERLSA